MHTKTGWTGWTLNARGAGPNDGRYGKVEGGSVSQEQESVFYRLHSVSAHYPRMQIPTLRISSIPA